MVGNQVLIIGGGFEVQVRHMKEGPERFKWICSAPTPRTAVKDTSPDCTSPDAGRSDVLCLQPELTQREASPAWKRFGTRSTVLLCVMETSQMKFHVILHLILWEFLMLSLSARLGLGFRHPLAGRVRLGDGGTQSLQSPLHLHATEQRRTLNILCC